MIVKNTVFLLKLYPDLSLSRLLSSLMGLVMPSPTAEGRSAISFSATS